MVSQSIWNPPQMPISGSPRAARFSSTSSSPRSRNHLRSATVDFVPGNTTRSARATTDGSTVHCTCTPGSQASASISVALDTRGKRMAATDNVSVPSGAFAGPTDAPATVPSESSASIHSPGINGTTPSTGTPVYSRTTSNPGVNSETSPRNLLTIKPVIRARSSALRIACVPTKCASTPPRSMSPATTTGKSASSANPMLAMSDSRRLTSAGLPAPSHRTTSNCPRSSSKASATTPRSAFLRDRYVRALTCPSALPLTTT